MIRAEEYASVDPCIYDRALVQYLIMFGDVRSLNSLKLFLALMVKCQWSVTYTDCGGEGQKRMVATITNNELRLTNTEARDTYGISPSAFYKAIRDLIDRGLIKKTGRDGGGNMYAICAPAILKPVYHRYQSIKSRHSAKMFWNQAGL
jgi:hypothetical protein